MDAVKLLIFEWVITNGSLPGFAERLEATKPMWKTVEADMTMYRGQGHSKKGIPAVGAVPPNVLKGDIRPIISTTKERASVLDYAGPDCCIFQIVLKPGVKYLDIEAMFGADDAYEDLADEVRKLAPASGSWVRPNTPRHVLTSFFMKNLKKEHEVMVLGGGTFTEPVSIGGTPQGFEVSYSPKTAGRRVQTFRRTSKSRSNGRRPARKSATRRYRKP